MTEVIVTISIFGAAQIGLLLVILGQMWATQKAHGERLDKLEANQQEMLSQVGKLEGMANA